MTVSSSSVSEEFEKWHLHSYSYLIKSAKDTLNYKYYNTKRLTVSLLYSPLFITIRHKLCSKEVKYAIKQNIEFYQLFPYSMYKISVAMTKMSRVNYFDNEKDLIINILHKSQVVEAFTQSPEREAIPLDIKYKSGPNQNMSAETFFFLFWSWWCQPLQVTIEKIASLIRCIKNYYQILVNILTIT